MTNAYNYLMKAGGIQSEEDYPYTGKSGECKFDPEKIVAKVTNFTNIPADEDQMAAHLVNHGPLAGKHCIHTNETGVWDCLLNRHYVFNF